MICKYSENVTEVTTRDLAKMPGIKGGKSIEQSPSLSDTEIEQLQFAFEDVKQSVNTLMDSIQKVLELEQASSLSTPRSKRLLPSPSSVPVRNKTKVQEEQG